MEDAWSMDAAKNMLLLSKTNTTRTPAEESICRAITNWQG
jgi:hypothetical protein